jgi:DNA mismatch repair ATPase MutL
MRVQTHAHPDFLMSIDDREYGIKINGITKYRPGNEIDPPEYPEIDFTAYEVILNFDGTLIYVEEDDEFYTVFDEDVQERAFEFFSSGGEI